MIGLWLALGVALALPYLVIGRRLTGRQARAWWAGGLIVAALAYVVFALSRGSLAGAAAELVGVGVFAVFAAMGLRGHRGWIAAGWLLHPLWDVGLHLATGLPSAPSWYMWTCLAFDAAVGVTLYLTSIRR